MSVDFSGHVYVAESGANRVAVFTPEGGFLNAVGSAGTGERRFQIPAGVCAARSFSLFVVDSEQDRVEVFDHGGSFAGWMPAEEGELQRPWGVDLGPDGRLYVVDRDNHRVVVVSASGGVVDRLGSLGSGPAQLREPTWIAVSDTRVVVSDTGNRRLQLFDLNGGYAGEITGGGAGHAFGAPAGVDIDEDGAFFVADSTAQKVVALDEHGAFLGETGRGAGDAEGPEVPAGLALGPGGRLYVADARGGRIFVYRVWKDGRIPSPR